MRHLGESWRSVRSLPSSAHRVLAAAGVNQVGAVLEGFLVVYLVQAGFAASLASFAIGAFAVGTLLGAPVGAWATTACGPRAAMSFSLVVTGALTIAIPLAAATESASLVTALALLIGVSTQAFRPPSSEVLSSAADGSDVVVAFSAFRVAMNAGALIAPLLVAAAIAGGHWDFVFVLDGVTSLVAAVVVARGPMPTAVGNVEARGPARWYAVFTWKRSMYFVAMVTSGLVYCQTYSVLPLQVQASGHSASLYAVVLSLGAVTLVLFELPVTAATKHWAAATSVLVGTLVFGLSYGLYAIAPGAVAMVLVACALCVAGTTISAPRLWSWPSTAPLGIRPAVFAASQAAFGLGVAIGPVVGVQCWQWLGRSWWVVVALIGVISAVTGWWAMRDRGEKSLARGAKLSRDG